MACGDSYREAARAEGYAQHSDVFAAAQRFHLVTATSKRIINRCRNVVYLSFEELERRLMDGDRASFGVKDVPGLL